MQGVISSATTDIPPIRLAKVIFFFDIIKQPAHRGLQAVVVFYFFLISIPISATPGSISILMSCLTLTNIESPSESGMSFSGNVYWKKFSPCPIGFPFLSMSGQLSVSLTVICRGKMFLSTIIVMLMNGKALFILIPSDVE